MAKPAFQSVKTFFLFFFSSRKFEGKNSSSVSEDIFLFFFFCSSYKFEGKNISSVRENVSFSFGNHFKARAPPKISLAPPKTSIWLRACFRLSFLNEPVFYFDKPKFELTTSGAMEQVLQIRTRKFKKILFQYYYVGLAWLFSIGLTWLDRPPRSDKLYWSNKSTKVSGSEFSNFRRSFLSNR